MAKEVSSLEKHYRHLAFQKPLSDCHYYAITLLRADDGQVFTACQSEWCGYTDTKPRREMRRGSFVTPEKMLESWQIIEEPGLVVNDRADLSLYVLFGGNAIIEATLAEVHFNKIISPHPSVFSRALGLRSIESVPQQLLQHAPTKKLRMRILKRDGYRCKICGRSPETYVDVELHVHHVHPWGDGGLTEEDNLITICKTCHDGLDPHFDHELFNFLGVSPHPGVIHGSDHYMNELQNYREHSFEVWQQIGIIEHSQAASTSRS